MSNLPLDSYLDDRVEERVEVYSVATVRAVLSKLPALIEEAVEARFQEFCEERLGDSLREEVDTRVPSHRDEIAGTLLEGVRKHQLELVEEAVVEASPRIGQVSAEALAGQVAPLIDKLLGHQVRQLTRLVEEQRASTPEVTVRNSVDLSVLERLFTDLSVKIDALIVALSTPKPRTVVITGADGRRIEGELK